MEENSRLTDEQKQKEEQELVKPVLNISKNKIQSSSLPLELLIFIDKIYSIIYYICELFLFIFKNLTFPYSSSRLALDVIIFILLILFHLCQLKMGKILYNLYLASMGNKSERTIFILFSIIIGIFALVALVFLVIAQKYITQFDFVLGIFALILDILVFFLSIFALVYIKSHEKNI